MQTKTLTHKTLKRKLNNARDDARAAAWKVHGVLDTDTNRYDGYDMLVLAIHNGTTTCYCIRDVSGMLTALMQVVHKVPDTQCIVHKFNKTYTQVGMLEAALVDSVFVNYKKPLALTLAKHIVALDKYETKKAKQAVYTAQWKAKQLAK